MASHRSGETEDTSTADLAAVAPPAPAGSAATVNTRPRSSRSPLTRRARRTPVQLVLVSLCHWIGTFSRSTVDRRSTVSSRSPRGSQDDRKVHGARCGRQ
ncbi:hypothetical protein [Umezawaea sp.]|uniref:hypothetical protein n=1 Tax=Umezawaea sp. TaxID=1955258 RepID=UPI0039C9D8C8